MNLSKRIPHAPSCGIFIACICDCYVKDVNQLEKELVTAYGKLNRITQENEAFKQAIQKAKG